MGLGVLEDYQLEKVPGTSKVGEDAGPSPDTGQYSHHGPLECTLREERDPNPQMQPAQASSKKMAILFLSRSRATRQTIR